MATRKDFFISYNNRDDKWAQWIAWNLEKEGYQVIIQAWDFNSGGNFVLDMHRAVSECERTIGVLSANSLSAPFVQQEWAAALAKDPDGKLQKFLPVRVDQCRPEGLFRAISYIDLVGLPRDQAREKLLIQAKQGRRKPATEPHFPGETEQPSAIKPPEYFPGQAVPLFICAADEDLRYVKELRKHLYQPQKRGELRMWHRSDIPPGAPIQAEIDLHFEEAQIILLMVSADLLGTPETDQLVSRAMDRHHAGKAWVIPILVSAADLKGVSFEGLLPLPRNQTPVVKWSDRDSAWTEVSQELVKVLARRPK